jgi:ribose transport system substrate-binding protein
MAGFRAGMTQGFKGYPNIKIVGSVYGNWTESIAESAVAAILPSLPTVNAVITATNEAYGAIEAFEAAGRPLPLAIGDGCACFSDWALAQEKKPGGYQTINYNPDPGIGYVTAYVALDILKHVKVPKSMVMPYLTVTQSQFPSLSKDPVGYQIQGTYSNAWVTKNILDQ